MISLPNPPPVRVALSGTTAGPANRFNQPQPHSGSICFPPFPFSLFSLTAPHPNLYSSIPLLIHPVPPPPSHHSAPLFFFAKKKKKKNIRLHVQGTSISSEHILPSSPTSSEGIGPGGVISDYTVVRARFLKRTTEHQKW